MKQRITNNLKAIGACWASSQDKIYSFEDNKYYYTIHPDCSYPHQDSIKYFSSLRELYQWTIVCKQASKCIEPVQVDYFNGKYVLCKMCNR